MIQVISKDTPVRIDGSSDGCLTIATCNDTYFINSFDEPFYMLVIVEDGLTSNDWINDGVKTVESWVNDREWKGTTPCLNGESAFMQGYGPWFLAPEDLEVWQDDQTEENEDD